MQILRTIEELRRWVVSERQQGQSLALVPTMGALHAGHISLIAAGARRCSRVMATIFVNPTQFGPNEDFAKYPRAEQADIDLLKQNGAHAVFLPTAQEIYPEGFATQVTVADISDDLCGKTRPGHFAGVATVVTKLLMQSLPDIALFGEKDYQQLIVIKRAAKDLDIPVRIIGVPTMREQDGLAMSSRNRYLSAAERKIAPLLFQILNQAAEEIKTGAPITQALTTAKGQLVAEGFNKVDYVELRDARTLKPVTAIDQPSRLLAAVFLGTTRLIDNIAVTYSATPS